MEVVTSNILQRVFAISTNKMSMGSCFAYPINGLFCFITAAHVLDDLEHSKEADIFIYKDAAWKPLRITPYFYEVGNDIDVAFFTTSLSSQENKMTPLELGSNGLALGQDCSFLGFPYFGDIEYRPENINSGYPIPFIKKATASAFHFHKGIIYIDGHNNPGFSGGPLVFWDYMKKKHKIAGIISSYLNHDGEVKELQTSNKAYYQENSGIALAFSIEKAIELIQKNLGVSIKA